MGIFERTGGMVVDHGFCRGVFLLFYCLNILLVLCFLWELIFKEFRSFLETFENAKMPKRLYDCFFIQLFIGMVDYVIDY
ncbi:hypothetical protein JCM6292_2597 [Bacteroides pyogenes JCM 6292]|uniref:Uncharacterized protein n=3 Tax=Bacteroides pyogenes TaxID=310300 RepID=W4P8S9_9BACE|nr:hypothetical protein JCM6292_2597 [Bacteroides pyogenes JCM 6292]